MNKPTLPTLAQVACTAALLALTAITPVYAQAPAASAASAASAAPAAPGAKVGPAPRMADGHVDLGGVWWTGGDLGSPGYETSNKLAGTGPSAPKSPSFTDLYQPWALEHAKTLRDKNDPTLQCKPTAFGTLSVRLFDVGAVGQIVSTPAMMVFLQETFHGYQQIPTDGRKHRPVPASFRGDAVGHWEGDTFVVETNNFTDDTWIFAEGRVSFHSDQLSVLERYTRTDAKTLIVEATVTDPKVLTAPWVVAKQTLTLAPADQLLPLICTGVETQELMDAAQK